MLFSEDCGQAAGVEYVLARDVVFVLAPDGSGRLLNLAGKFHAISASAAGMLQLTLERGRAAAVAAVAARYEVSTPQVQEDLDGFLRELERQGLIISFGARRYLPRAGAALAALVLGAALHCLYRGPRYLKARVWWLLTLARLSFRIFGWPHTIAAWQDYHRQVAPPKAAPFAEPDLGTIDEAVREVSAKHLFRTECKERGLACWSLLRAAGRPAKLVVGINLFPLEGHCWCQCGSRVFDYGDRCERFTPVLEYA
jgi:hypothetical protein